MNIVEPYARLIGPTLPTDPFLLEDGIRCLRRIEYFGRISHRSEDAQTPTSWERFLKTVVFEHGDWSIVEHASVTVDMLVDRGITHELVRHRLFSFTQESTMFVNYEKKMPPSFIKPPLLVEGRQERDWYQAIERVESMYKALILDGCAPQIARSVFPNALASRIIISGNLRNWRHFFIMRTTKEAHPQMRQVTIPLLREFQEKIPILYDDIEPNAKQSESMKRMR